MTLFQYSRRISVTVACAAQPCRRSFATAARAASFEANSPYNVDPEPDSDAYFAPARSSALLPSLSSGYSGKTTCSKSFLIPARTSSRSGFSRRPLLKGAPEYISPSHADSPRPSSTILSDEFATVNFPLVLLAFPLPVGGSGVLMWGRALLPVRAGRSPPAAAVLPSPAALLSHSAKALGVDTPTSGVTTTHAVAGGFSSGYTCSPRPTPNTVPPTRNSGRSHPPPAPLRNRSSAGKLFFRTRPRPSNAATPFHE